MIAKVAVQIGTDKEPTYRIGVEVEIRQEDPALAAVEATQLAAIPIALESGLNPEELKDLLDRIEKERELEEEP